MNRRSSRGAVAPFVRRRGSAPRRCRRGLRSPACLAPPDQDRQEPSAAERSSRDVCARRRLRDSERKLVVLELGRPTSTRRQGREQAPTLGRFEAADGIDVNYTEDVNDNDEFFAKVVQTARLVPADRPRHLWCSPTGWPAKLIKLGYAAEKLEPGQHPECKNLLRRAEAPGLRPGPELLGAVASRPDRHRLELRGLLRTRSRRR